MVDDLRFPAIIVTHLENDFHKKRAGGGKARAFADVDKTQKEMLDSCSAIKADLNKISQSSQKFGIAKLKIRDEAHAKSHRPIETFTSETCPVIGDLDDEGELLVLVSPDGLDRLSKKIRSLGHNGSAHLTSIESFALVEAEKRFSERAQKAVHNRLQLRGHARLKIRIPGFHILADLFRQELAALKFPHAQEGVETSPFLYQGDFELYAVEITDMKEAKSLASLSFVDQVELMPIFVPSSSFAVYPAGLRLGNSVPIQDLPIVAIVDSGIDRNSPLERLVWDRKEYVKYSCYNPTHGTAVASIVAAQDGIVSNVLVPRCRLLDITLIPNHDEEFGEVDELLLNDVVLVLRSTVKKYHSEVKFWNLSLSAHPDSQQSSAFSDLGKELDFLHKEYGVNFYCAAGNIKELSDYRTQWPPITNGSPEFWISSPGDTVCGTTVGACTDDNIPTGALAPEGAPSPFSPRGPVASGVIKPDLVEIGGNIGIVGGVVNCAGVQTMQRNGNISPMSGTSFSTPRVCGTATEINACVEQSHSGFANSHLLSKALTLHHANIPATFALTGNTRLSDYYGYGKPSSLEDTLGDQFWRCTTLISGSLYPNGEELIIDDFPFPDDLCNDERSWGSIWITMVSDPLLDGSFKREYIRSNIDVHFGTMYRGRFNGCVKGVRTGVKANEASLIREVHKWSPIKQYRSLSKDYPGNCWQLRASLTVREKESAAIRKGVNPYTYPVDFVVAITIADPLKIVQVNNQVFQKWRLRGYVPTPVAVMPRLRARFNTIK